MTARQLIDRPIIVLGCNRSGTTLLFNNLSWHPGTWSLYIESQDVFYRHHPIDPEQGDRLVQPPGEEIARAIRLEFYRRAHNKEAFKDSALLRCVPRKVLQRPLNVLYKRPPLRLVEKTPANALRVPFLKALFPDARFVFLVRRGEAVVSSLMEGWKNWSRPRTGDGPWHYSRWHYLLPPGWQDWKDRALQEICAFQWVEATRTAWDDLNRCCAGQFMMVHHEDVIAHPRTMYRKILEFCDLPPSAYFRRQIGNIGSRVYTTGGSAPQRDKWRKLHQAEIESVQHMLKPLNEQFYG